MIFAGISWYVSPDGSPSGDGSAERPWDIATALGHPESVEPGDVIWLAGGVYRPTAPLEAALAGTPDKPIEVWGDPDGPPAVLDFADGRPHGVHLSGSYAHYGDFEIRCSATARWSDVPGSGGNPRGTGILAETGLGVRLIRVTVCDFGTSLFESQPSGIEILGCTFRNSYWDAPDRSHGPGLYIRNPQGAPRKRIAGNVIFQHGRQGIQGFGSTPFSEMDVVGNTLFNNGIAGDGFHRNFMFGNATDEHRNVVIQDNVTYFPAGHRLGHEANMAGGDGGSHGLRLEGNWIAHEGRPAFTANRADSPTIAGNRFVGDVAFTSFDETVSAENEDFAQMFSDNTYWFGPARPSGVWTRTTVDETLPDMWRREARTLVTVVNWDLESEVEVDLSAAAGELAPAAGSTVHVCSVQNPGQVLELTYDATPLVLPMGGWNAEWPTGRDGGDPLPSTLPEFGAFELRWPVGGESAPRERTRIPDPGRDLPAPAARVARQAEWEIQDPTLRELLREERIAQWRSQALGRPL